MLLRYKKLNKDATEPTCGHEGDAGLDLYSVEDYQINAGNTVMVHTGIAVEIPPGYFGAVYARSGLATKQGLRPANCVGVIDSPYRGEIIVALHNDSICTCRTVKKGDRIAQLIIQPYMSVILQETDELSDTTRGSGGFGSTGVSSPNNTCFDYEQITLKEVVENKDYYLGGGT